MEDLKASLSCQDNDQWEVDSAYSTFSFTTRPLFMARSSTKDIYRWRLIPDFAASKSKHLTSLLVRRTVTGLAVSAWDVMACEHVRYKKYATHFDLQPISSCLCNMRVIQHNQ